jgi:hypothetical protein
MTLRLFGAGAFALACLVMLSAGPAAAQSRSVFDTRGQVRPDDRYLPTNDVRGWRYEGRGASKSRRHFREHQEQRRDGGAVRGAADADVRGVAAQTDNDGRPIVGPAGEPVRLARGAAAAGIEPGAGRVAEILPHPPGCPRRAFCGCGAAVRVFGAPIRALWLAANWLKFPPAAPAPGMVAARRGHVFVIEAVVGPGKVIAYDANSGRGLTRRHVRSLAGFSVRDPRASS